MTTNTNISHHDKFHTILLEKIAELEKQLKDRQYLVEYKNSQIDKAHRAITENFGGGNATKEGLVLEVRIKALKETFDANSSKQARQGDCRSSAGGAERTHNSWRPGQSEFLNFSLTLA